MERPESIPLGNGTMFPRKPLLFGGGIFRRLCWGSRGPSSSSGVALILGSPWRVLSWTAPAARSLFSAAKPLRRFCAAPRVRRSTQGAPVWGDRSLSNKRGPRCAVRRGEQKRMGGWEAPLLEGVKSAAFGRIEKLGRAWRGNPPSPAGETFVPARGGNLSSGARNRSLPRGNPALRRFWDDNPSGGRAASSLYTREPYRVRLRRKAKTSRPHGGGWLFFCKGAGALTPPDFWYTAPGWR